MCLHSDFFKTTSPFHAPFSSLSVQLSKNSDPYKLTLQNMKSFCSTWYSQYMFIHLLHWYPDTVKKAPLELIYHFHLQAPLPSWLLTVFVFLYITVIILNSLSMSDQVWTRIKLVIFLLNKILFDYYFIFT